MKYLIIILFFCISCSKKEVINPIKIEENKEIEEIKSIELSNFGGEMGFWLHFSITKDSLMFYSYLAVDSTKNQEVKISNSKYPLNQIFDKADLNAFSQIKSGKSYQPVDGTDTELRITTNKNEYVATNAENNKLWDDLSLKIFKILHSEFGEE